VANWKPPSPNKNWAIRVTVVAVKTIWSVSSVPCIDSVDVICSCKLLSAV